MSNKLTTKAYRSALVVHGQGRCDACALIRPGTQRHLPVRFSGRVVCIVHALVFLGESFFGVCVCVLNVVLFAGQTRRERLELVDNCLGCSWKG